MFNPQNQNQSFFDRVSAVQDRVRAEQRLSNRADISSATALLESGPFSDWTNWEQWTDWGKTS